jgi:ABC-type molybdate transport system substrate-binding protein
MRVLGWTASIAVVLISLGSMAGAADIRVLGVEAVQHAVRSLAAGFATQTGHRVILTIESPAVVMQRIKDHEIHDAVIVSEPAMDELDREGIVNPESRVKLATDASTLFEGALMSDGSVPEVARAFIRFLASEDARDQWIAARLQPAPDH